MMDTVKKLLGRAGGVTHSLSDAMTQAHRKRVAETALFWEYYKGIQRKPLKVKRGQSDYNVIENWSGNIVDTSVDFLFSGGLEFIVSDDDETKQAYIDSVWDSLNFGVFTRQLGQSGANGRNAFIRLLVDDDGNITPKVVDPDMVSIEVNPANIDEVLSYSILWTDDVKVYRHHIVKVEGGTWEIRQEVYSGSGSWSAIPGSEPVKWDYPFPDMFHCQNIVLAHSVWGQADLEDLNLQDAINRTKSNTNKIIQYNAAPQGMAKGAFGLDAIDAAPDQFITLPPDGDLSYLEMSSDLSSSKTFADDTKDAYMSITQTPSFDKEDINGAMSGFALTVLMGQAIHKAEGKRATYGGLFEKVNHALLVLGGFEPVTVNNMWGDMLPENKAEMATMAKTLVDAGLDKLEALVWAGFDLETAEKMTASAITLPTQSPISALLQGTEG